MQLPAALTTRAMMVMDGDGWMDGWMVVAALLMVVKHDPLAGTLRHSAESEAFSVAQQQGCVQMLRQHSITNQQPTSMLQVSG
jgi:hypothetical protein